MLDHELVALVQAFLAKRREGATSEESSAWEEFFVRYDPAIRAGVRRIHTALNLVDDVTQDVWVLLIRKLPRWNYDSQQAAIGIWVTEVARRVAQKRTRRRARPAADVLNATHADMLVDPEPNPAIAFERMQEHDLFRAFVSEFAERLPERDAASFSCTRCGLPPYRTSQQNWPYQRIRSGV